MKYTGGENDFLLSGEHKMFSFRQNNNARCPFLFKYDLAGLGT
jgi:hypothetical protein